MFTLKLWRRDPIVDESTGRPTHVGRKVSKIVEVEHVHVLEIGILGHALEIQAVNDKFRSGYMTFYVGEPEEGMDAFGRDDRHLEFGNDSWWGWGLLENSAGQTTEHYRPASYG